jgi:4-hydroxybenzoate polyprenyltransferase
MTAGEKAMRPIGRGYFFRMHDYLREMLPIPRHALVAALAAAGIVGFTTTVQSTRAPLSSAAVLSVGWNVLAMLVILRLMDELKDAAIDRRLFPERPLPSGRVSERDIRIGLGAMAALYMLSNLYSPATAISALVVLGYALLMFKRFFAPALLERSLPITLATHTPIVPIIWSQAFVAAASARGIPLSDMRWGLIALYVSMLWLAMLGWEISRKIRCAEEESEYVTYSQILGRAGAVKLTIGAQTGAALIGFFFWLLLGLGSPYLVLVVLGWAVSCWGHARFLIRPDRRTSRLKPYASALIIGLLLAQIYGFVLARL